MSITAKSFRGVVNVNVCSSWVDNKGYSRATCAHTVAGGGTLWRVSVRVTATGSADVWVTLTGEEGRRTRDRSHPCLGGRTRRRGNQAGDQGAQVQLAAAPTDATAGGGNGGAAAAPTRGPLAVRRKLRFHRIFLSAPLEFCLES